MRHAAALCLITAAAGALSACSSNSSLFNRVRPDEFAVSRQAPLIVPPDFALTPPNPGAPRPQDVDSSKQAQETLFGGPAPRSAIETDTLGKAGPSAVGIRTTVGDPQTKTVAKGAATRDVITAPEGNGPGAKASIPQ